MESIILFSCRHGDFSLVEYFIHRYIFHFNAVNEKEEQLKYHIHGVHHEYPRDKDRLVMPPLISFGIAILFYFFFKFIAGDYVWLFFRFFGRIFNIPHYPLFRTPVQTAKKFP